MAPEVGLVRPVPSALLLNIFQLDAVGCHIITFTNDILRKRDDVLKDPDGFSLDTVKMSREDALRAGSRLHPLTVGVSERFARVYIKLMVNRRR